MPGTPSVIVTHQLGWRKGVQFAGQYLAQALGFLDAEGVAAEFIEGGADTNYRGLVASGRVLVSESTPLGMIDAALEGQDLVAFAAVMQRDPAALLSQRGRPIASLSDMLGKTIAAPAGVSHLVRALLRRADLPADDVAFTRPGDDAGRLAAREIDGYYGHATVAVPALRALGIDPHTLLLGDLGAPGYAQALIVRRDVLDDHHDLLVRYLRALVKGWRHFVEHPEESTRLIVEQWATDAPFEEQLGQAAMMRDFILAGDALSRGILWIDPARFDQALTFARETGLAPADRKIDAGRLATQSLIKQALA